MNPVSNYVFRCMLCVAFMLSQFFASALTCKNGVFVTLNGDAEATVSAEEFVLYSNSCCGSGLNYDLSLNNGASFQPNATLNCDDLGQLPIRVRFTDCLGVVNFCESFVIVQGNLGICDVGCGGCCLPNVKFQPLTVSFYDDYSLKLHASWFNDGSYSDCATGALQFSFSSNPNDTLKTYTCDDLGQSAVQLWVTDAGGNQSFGETFVIAQFAFGDCTGTGPCLPAPVAYNGIVVPLNPVGEASVHARGFDLASHVSTCSSATSFTMAFSDDPNDTLAFFTCDDVGQQLVQIFVHDNLGNVNYIETFVIVQDLSDYCDPSGNLVPPNDDVCNAYDINYLINSGCKEYFFNIGADAGTSEVTPPMGACGVPNTWCDAATVAEKTVWFKFEAPATHEIAITTTGMNTQLALWTAESCGVLKAGFAALIAANDDDLSLTGGGSRLVAECLEAGKTYYVQMDGHSNTEGVFGLNFTATGPPCDVSTSESKLIENGFAILPNPASALVNLGVQTPANWLGGQAVMTDVGGKVVLVQNIDGENIPLYIDHLSPGIYFLYLRNGSIATTMQKLAIFH